MISFISEHPEFQLDSQEKYSIWVEKIINSSDKRIGTINFTFVTNKKILEINRRYLNHNYFTDIITFDNSFMTEISGEIFISIDTVYTNAKNHDGGNKQRELNRVIIHGVLHLLGFNDSTEKEKREMRKMEDSCIKMFMNERF